MKNTKLPIGKVQSEFNRRKIPGFFCHMNEGTVFTENKTQKTFEKKGG